MKCFENPNDDLDTATEKWFSVLNTIIKNCFKKIRINSREKNDQQTEALFEEKERLLDSLSNIDDMDEEAVQEVYSKI